VAYPITDQEVRAFLTDVPARTGNLATVHADGRPHSAPVWYDVDDGGALVFNTGVSAVKGRNLSGDPRARSASTTSGAVRRWAARIGGRSMGYRAGRGVRVA